MTHAIRTESLETLTVLAHRVKQATLVFNAAVRLAESVGIDVDIRVLSIEDSPEENAISVSLSLNL